MVAEQAKARAASPHSASQYRASGLGAATYPRQAALPARTLSGPRLRDDRGQRGVRKARKRGWRSPMTAAVLVGTFLVSLLCCYVYAYARVTAAGIELSSVRRDLQKARQEEDALRAEISRLSLPAALEHRAQGIGMVPAPPQAAKVLPATEGQGHRAVAQSGR